VTHQDSNLIARESFPEFLRAYSSLSLSLSFCFSFRRSVKLLLTDEVGRFRERRRVRDYRGFGIRGWEWRRRGEQQRGGGGRQQQNRRDNRKSAAGQLDFAGQPAKFLVFSRDNPRNSSFLAILEALAFNGSLFYFLRLPALFLFPTRRRIASFVSGFIALPIWNGRPRGGSEMFLIPILLPRNGKLLLMRMRARSDRAIFSVFINHEKYYRAFL